MNDQLFFAGWVRGLYNLSDDIALTFTADENLKAITRGANKLESLSFPLHLRVKRIRFISESVHWYDCCFLTSSWLSGDGFDAFMNAFSCVECDSNKSGDGLLKRKRSTRAILVDYEMLRNEIEKPIEVREGWTK